MNKNIKIIIIVMIILTILDILISVIWLNMFPVFSIMINVAVIGLILKYSIRKKNDPSQTDKRFIGDCNSEKIDIKRLATLLLIPFVTLAVVLTYVFYLLSVR